MKKITLLLLFVSSLGFSQTTLFSDDFESYTDFVITGFGNWITIDDDGLNTYTGGVDSPTYPNAGAAMAYQIFNPSTTTPSAVTNDLTGASGETRDFDPRSGAKYAAAWAAVPAAPVTANDDWLVSPVISLATTGNSVSFWVKAMSDSYGPENYNVGVYVGAGTPTSGADFTIISAASLTAPYGVWTEDTYDLAAYNDMDIRIGIHCISADRYMFMVDDFEVETTLGVEEFSANAFNHSYNKNTKQLTLESSSVPFDHIDVYNILGQRVISKSLSQLNELVDLSSLKDGVYLAKVTIEGQTQTIKLLKQ